MQLSKRTEYGLRRPSNWRGFGLSISCKRRDLATQEKLPSKFLESILLALKRGGFLESKVGSGGGYRLSRSPAEINVGDLLRRLEGRLATAAATQRTDETLGETAVDLINSELSKATDLALDSMTLEHLLDHANRTAGSQQSEYYI